MDTTYGQNCMCRARASPASPEQAGSYAYLHVGLVVTSLCEDARSGRVGELSLVAPAFISLEKCHQVAS